MKQSLLKTLLLCLFSFVGVTAFAYDCEIDGIYYNINKNNKTADVTYLQYGTLNNATYKGDVVIPSSIIYEDVTYNVTGIGDYAFYFCYDLISIAIPNSIKSIGTEAFWSCIRLKSIVIPNSVTEIGNSAFGSCGGFESIIVETGNPYYDSRDNCNAIIYTNGDEVTLIAGCKNTTIPNGVTSIGEYAFSSCSGLTSINIPNSVTSIGNSAFSSCFNLTSINIPNSVTSIGFGVFQMCSSLTSIFIPKSVTEIGTYVFSQCTNLETILVESGNPYYDSREDCNAIIYTNGEEVTLIAGCKSTTIPNGVTSIGERAFNGCSGLTSINIPGSVTSIDNGAFNFCGLNTINIPNGVTSIDMNAFGNCRNLTSISISSSVTFLGDGFLVNCENLEKIVVEAGNPYYDSREDCNAIIYTNGDEVTLIVGCKNTKIPDGVTSIGRSAFYWCYGLMSINIPNSVTSIGDYAFDGCSCLIVVDTDTPPIASSSCFSNNMIAIVPSSAVDAYKNAEGWKNLPINVPFLLSGTTQTTITLNTFDALTDTYVMIGEEEYVPQDNTIKITGLVPDQTYTISMFGKYKIGEKTQTGSGGTTGTTIPIYKTLDGTMTVTTLAITMNISFAENTNVRQTIIGSHNAGDAIIEQYGFEGYEGQNEITMEGLVPGRAYNYTYYVVTSDGSKFTKTSSLSTKAITINASVVNTGATHCELEGDFSVIDATVIGYGFTDNPDKKNIKITGLDPYTTYTKTFYVETEEGGLVTKDVRFTTNDLTLITSQPKVISVGNAIVAADSNLDDAETNVGFEWRRTDWNDDFASNTGVAYLYNGTMEGYIRNLNTNYLWKYRPYYLSNSGTYYYGDWVGLDPTNTSYFEPTVHTYEQVEIIGNTALVKGYALTGTDGVAVQGFKYWKDAAGTQSVNVGNRAASVPSDAMTVEASGQVMTTSLTGLDYGSTYHYTAFVTTSTGETFYGEEQVFSIGGDPTGLHDIMIEKPNVTNTLRQGVYTLTGVKVAEDTLNLHSLPKGIYIINGKKVVVK